MRQRPVACVVLVTCLLALIALAGAAQARALSFERHDCGVTGPTPSGMVNRPGFSGGSFV